MNKSQLDTTNAAITRRRACDADPPAIAVRMGEIAVVSNGEPARALLGSCIGLAIHDAKNQVGGLAHILLPNSSGHDGPPGKFVDTAIPELIRLIGAARGDISNLAARITGGARMFETSAQVAIGEQNAVAVEKGLAEYGIPVLGRHCGGTQGRRIMFCPDSGGVCIEMIGCEAIEI